MNSKIDATYDFISELQKMTSSAEPDYGFTERQLEILAEKSGVGVAEFRECFFIALNKIAAN
ncbi:hypothetical protein OH460_07675 [Vibrio sp. Makdt]|uniref:hypothetical protein n=1 Tax=Vibrio sp. Makdt TaxID=2998828 RepID=UPI0022CD4CAE|nr:hypothetical protein [Vibrio sp. Makdt]MDA0152175.1 hypothetical protein [Vibrio sp. Makdt]